MRPPEPVDPDLPRVPAGPERDVLAVIALGGVVGAEARYALGTALPVGSGVPWTTVGTNVSGCLLIGVLLVLVSEVRTAHRLVRPLLGTGVLGGYTTFSTFAVDVDRLLRDGHPVAAVATLVVTPVAAIAAVTAGTLVTRRLAGRPVPPPAPAR